jgi:hypothetical protein
VQNFAIRVFTNLKDDRVQPDTDPTNGNVLLRHIAALILPVGTREQFPCLFESYASIGVCSKALTFSSVECEAHPTPLLYHFSKATRD